jgi:hypothetical protein
MAVSRVVAERYSLVVAIPADEAPGMAAIAQPGGRILVTPGELRWLLHTGGPAALATLIRDHPQEDPSC